MKYEVSAQWMKDCGFGSEAKVFKVIKTYRAGLLSMVVVDRDGQPWTLVSTWRGWFVAS
jgi:hypothetical protein